MIYEVRGKLQESAKAKLPRTGLREDGGGANVTGVAGCQRWRAKGRAVPTAGGSAILLPADKS